MPGCFARHPLRGAQGATGKGLAAGGPVGQFQPFPGGGKNNGVIAHHVAAAQGVDADFRAGALAHQSFAAMTQQRRTASWPRGHRRRFGPAFWPCRWGRPFSCDGAFRQSPRRNPGPRISAALRVNQNKALTPVEKFALQTSGICAEIRFSSCCSVSEWPVVPMTIAFLCSAQIRASGTVLRAR